MMRQALSGVARMSNRLPGGRWEGRFGKGRVIAMLTGSRSREVLDARLDQLSTYGMLKSIGSNGVHQLFQEMEKHGLVQVSSGEYPLISLTSKGDEAMRLGKAPKMRWPALNGKASPLKPGTSSTVAEVKSQELGFDDALFDKLKRLRLALA